MLVTLENAPSYVLTRHGATRERLIAAALEAGAGMLVTLERLVQMEQVPLALSRRTAQAVRIN